MALSVNAVPFVPREEFEEEEIGPEAERIVSAAVPETTLHETIEEENRRLREENWTLRTNIDGLRKEIGDLQNALLDLQGANDALIKSHDAQQKQYGRVVHELRQERNSLMISLYGKQAHPFR